jgi:hypothetical protein
LRDQKKVNECRCGQGAREQSGEHHIHSSYRVVVTLR